MSTWFITGASSGLGRALAEAALSDGHDVVLAVRRPESVQDVVDSHPEHSLAVALDVTDGDAVTAAVGSALDRFGRIDVLVNNAGHGYRGAVEEGVDAEVAELFATNFFGPVTLLKAALPSMRERRSGAVVNVSSIGARATAAGSGYYSATKAALEGMSGALRHELAPLGISVTVVEPGAFRTDFAGRSLEESSTVIADYAETAGRRRKAHDTSHGTQPGDPAKAATAVLAAVSSPSPPFFLLLGTDALTGFAAAQAALGDDVDAWRELSSGTDRTGDRRAARVTSEPDRVLLAEVLRTGENHWHEGDYAALAPRADVGQGLAVAGEDAADTGPHVDTRLGAAGLLAAA